MISKILRDSFHPLVHLPNSTVGTIVPIVLTQCHLCVPYLPRSADTWCYQPGSFVTTIGVLYEKCWVIWPQFLRYKKELWTDILGISKTNWDSFTFLNCWFGAQVLCAINNNLYSLSFIWYFELYRCCDFYIWCPNRLILLNTHLIIPNFEMEVDVWNWLESVCYWIPFVWHGDVY